MACTGPRAYVPYDPADASAYYHAERERVVAARQSKAARAIAEVIKEHGDILLDEKARERMKKYGSPMERSRSDAAKQSRATVLARKCKHQKSVTPPRAVSVEAIREAAKSALSWRDLARRVGVSAPTIIKYRDEGYIPADVVPQGTPEGRTRAQVWDDMRVAAPHARNWRHLAKLVKINYSTLCVWRSRGTLPADILPAAWDGDRPGDVS
jgi:DNA-binding transcriptional regulator YiaG